MSFLLFPATPADFGIFILTFLSRSELTQGSPSWLAALWFSPLCVAEIPEDRDGHAPPHPPSAHTQRTCAHTDGGSSQQKQPSPCTPPALSRIKLATHLPEKMRVSVWGWGMRKKPVSTLQTPTFFFSPAPSSFSKMYDSE